MCSRLRQSIITAIFLSYYMLCNLVQLVIDSFLFSRVSDLEHGSGTTRTPEPPSHVKLTVSSPGTVRVFSFLPKEFYGLGYFTG